MPGGPSDGDRGAAVLVQTIGHTHTHVMGACCRVRSRRESCSIFKTWSQEVGGGGGETREDDEKLTRRTGLWAGLPTPLPSYSNPANFTRRPAEFDQMRPAWRCSGQMWSRIGPTPANVCRFWQAGCGIYSNNAPGRVLHESGSNISSSPSPSSQGVGLKTSVQCTISQR